MYSLNYGLASTVIWFYFVLYLISYAAVRMKIKHTNIFRTVLISYAPHIVYETRVKILLLKIITYKIFSTRKITKLRYIPAATQYIKQHMTDCVHTRTQGMYKRMNARTHIPYMYACTHTRAYVCTHTRTHTLTHAACTRCMHTHHLAIVLESGMG